MNHIYLALLVTFGASQAQGQGRNIDDLDCGYQSPAVLKRSFLDAVSAGLIPDPSAKPIRSIAPIVRSNQGRAASSCLSTAQIHLYEDTNQLLLTNFSTTELLNFMVDAMNDLMAVHGDNFDFTGFWLNFAPDHEIGAAFYWPLENDVAGIGDASTAGTPIFNDRPFYGINGQNIEGAVMMWDVNHSYWETGPGPGLGNATFTRLVLAQEFEHRFGMFLPNTLSGLQLQGDDGNCGRSFHWNWKVDGQGSGMEISEWVGTNPANLAGSFVNFNSDIPGGVFSYPDLYLMGYVSPAEMDAGVSELRYMRNSNCSSAYSGSIDAFTSADIIGSAGPRIPDVNSAQKHWRTGWIMIHLPGALPSQVELQKATEILSQHMLDWNHSTIGRGTMDNTLFDECNQVNAYGCGANPAGSLVVVSGQPSIGRILTLGVDNPLGTQSVGSIPILALSTAADANFPCGTLLSGFGMGMGPGELLIDFTNGNPLSPLLVGAPWMGSGNPAPVNINVPAQAGLLGLSLYVQGLLFDPSPMAGVRFGLTEAFELVVGP